MTNTSKLNHTFPVSTLLKPHDAIPSETDIIVLGTFTEPVTVICYMLSWVLPPQHANCISYYLLISPYRFTYCDKCHLQQVIKYPHLHLGWWACYKCYLEEKWHTDNSQWYPPADTDADWSNHKYLPDSAHHRLFSESEWLWGDIQLHSRECLGRVVRDSGCSRWDLNCFALTYHSMFTPGESLFCRNLCIPSSAHTAFLSVIVEYHHKPVTMFKFYQLVTNTFWHDL